MARRILFGNAHADVRNSRNNFAAHDVVNGKPSGLSFLQVHIAKIEVVLIHVRTAVSYTHLNGKTTLVLDGGELQIENSSTNGDVIMTGPAQTCLLYTSPPSANKHTSSDVHFEGDFFGSFRTQEKTHGLS